jgi:hypothetical protein
MPAWSADPNNPPPLLVIGTPGYSAGSPGTPGPSTRMAVTQSAVAANVVTLTVAVVEGNIPAVGDIVYVSATKNNAGALNTAVGIALTGVTINATTGVGTITYPVTTGNLAPTADVGFAISKATDVPEALVANQAYRAFAIPKLSGDGPNRSFTINVAFPTVGGAVLKWILQAAMRNIDSDYTGANLIGDTAAGGTYSDSGVPGASTNTGQFWPGAWNFVRFKDDGTTGIAGTTVVARILMM